jgi:uncharacterized protein YggT (Ycf19 family)
MIDPKSILDFYAFGLLVYMVLSKPKYHEAAKIRTWLERIYLPLLVPTRAVFRPISFGRAALDPAPSIAFLLLMVFRTLLRGWN